MPKCGHDFLAAMARKCANPGGCSALKDPPRGVHPRTAGLCLAGGLVDLLTAHKRQTVRPT